jgi:hypothetical protein
MIRCESLISPGKLSVVLSWYRIVLIILSLSVVSYEFIYTTLLPRIRGIHIFHVYLTLLSWF